jgi:NADH-quinone oxidoreductase subunit A
LTELDKFIIVGLFLLLAVAMGGGMLVVSYLFSFVRLRPSPPKEEEGPYKRAAYECGAEAVGGSWPQFNVRYYFFALLYLLFAVEAVFLFPWAVRVQALGFAGFIAMLAFLGIQLVGFVYEWKRGGLEWQ